MSNPIHALLAEAKAKLERVERKIADAERERDMLLAQVNAYVAAAKAVEASQQGSDAAAVELTLPSHPPAPKDQRFRPAKEEWNHVFAALYHNYANEFGYDEIASVAERLGVQFKRASLRTKMMNYVNERILDRVDNGRFRITNNGFNFFNVPQHPPVGAFRDVLDL